MTFVCNTSVFNVYLCHKKSTEHKTESPPLPPPAQQCSSIQIHQQRRLQHQTPVEAPIGERIPQNNVKWPAVFELGKKSKAFIITWIINKNNQNTHFITIFSSICPTFLYVLSRTHYLALRMLYLREYLTSRLLNRTLSITSLIIGPILMSIYLRIYTLI
jgi:hypothetical protein